MATIREKRPYLWAGRGVVEGDSPAWRVLRGLRAYQACVGLVGKLRRVSATSPSVPVSSGPRAPICRFGA